MFSFGLLLALTLQAISFSSAAQAPTVKLDSATITGVASNNVHQFLGIPFAKPPVGDLRYRLPQSLPPYAAPLNATAYGPSCPQQIVSLPLITGLPAEAADYLIGTIFQTIFPDSEDCLSINVVKPANAAPDAKLPVLVWIFGGGFELGATSMYDGSATVARSIALGEPVIFVSMNYRLTGFGFLSSKEVKEAGVGNLGLQDQREALRWIQKYIGAFGGDPSKVTIWGESAGAISVAMQMIANGGNAEGLFRAGVMESGAPIPVGDITNGQREYDFIVNQTGCSGAADTLACLRTVPYSKIKAAINDTPNIFSYQSLRLAWLPRADGLFITDHPQRLVQQGKVANVPFITGNCDDEGTLFSLANANISTTSQFKAYLKNTFLPGITDTQVNRIADLYPATPSEGSPFNTGIFNAITPQFKRLAAFQGDGVFQAPRRWFLKNTVGKQNIWVFISRRFKALPILGSVHASDLLSAFFLDGDLKDYIINFTNNLDPNKGSSGYSWPKYTASSKKALLVSDGLIQREIIDDNFRIEAMEYLTEVTLVSPV